MILSKKDLVALYRRRAKRYDFTANLYYLIGFQEWSYRQKAVEALALRPGDTVIEVGCGTGLNFGLLEKAVGAQGKIIGIDLNDAMLAQAKNRVARHGWRNIELVHTDAATFEYPPEAGGVLSTFAITLIPECDEVVRRGAQALAAGKRFVILDIGRPAGAPDWLIRLAVLVTAPFGATLEMMERRPWESLKKYLGQTYRTEFYFGFCYLAIGKWSGGG